MQEDIALLAGIDITLGLTFSAGCTTLNALDTITIP